MVATPTEGAVYEQKHTETKMVCTHSPDTVGVPTHRAEHKPVEFETLDGEHISIYADNFRGNYRKIADSREELEA